MIGDHLKLKYEDEAEKASSKELLASKAQR